MTSAGDAGVAAVDFDGLSDPRHPGMFVVLKRGLFYKPLDCGYTGIRDHAGIYTEAEAQDRARPKSGVSIMRWEDAPEFTDACFDDLARKHLQQKRDVARDAACRLAAELAAARAEVEAKDRRIAKLEAELESHRSRFDGCPHCGMDADLVARGGCGWAGDPPAMCCRSARTSGGTDAGRA